MHCSKEVAAKLIHISPKTMDRLLAREKQVRGLRQKRNPSTHPLLYRKIPVKVAAEPDTGQMGNLQVDYVLQRPPRVAGALKGRLSILERLNNDGRAQYDRLCRKSICRHTDSESAVISGMHHPNSGSWSHPRSVRCLARKQL